MNKELKERILQFNRVLSLRREKAEDLDVLVQAILRLPSGQIKKLLTEEVLTVLSKYGYVDE